MKPGARGPNDVCVYYCSAYYKAVREDEGGGGYWMTCAVYYHVVCVCVRELRKGGS